jgi:hypothetical protein
MSTLKPLSFTGLKNTTVPYEVLNPKNSKLQTIIEAPKRILTDKEEKDMKLAFDLYDIRGSGEISKDDALKII